MNPEHHHSNEIKDSTQYYAAIEAANKESYLLHEPAKLEVIHSLHSVGESRDLLNDAGQAAARIILSGNMSTLNGYGPNELTPEMRKTDAQNNVQLLLEQYAINPKEVRLLAPERDYTTPLTKINLDTTELEYDDAGIQRPVTKGDFIYSYKPETVLAVRPADCPVAFISGETPNGEISVLLHLAWLGTAHGYVQQAKEHLDELGFDWKSAQIRLSAGAHAQSYTYQNYDSDPREKFPVHEGLFLNVHKNKTGTYDFAIDAAAGTYKQIVKSWNIEPYQLFMDTTDTAAADAGYSSHSRSYKGYPGVGGENSRDLIIARRQ